jgi:uncharacterized protein (TIGR00369 family)
VVLEQDLGRRPRKTPERGPDQNVDEAAQAFPFQSSKLCRMAKDEYPLLEVLRRWQPEGMWANVGGRMLELEPGRALIEAQLSAASHGFPTGMGSIVHGGALAAVADMALASAGASLCREGEVATTVDLKVDFFQPGQPGRILARATVRRRTRRLAFCETTLEQEDGTVIAEARAVMAYIRA